MTGRKRKILFAISGGIVAATVITATWIGIRVFQRFVPYWPPAVSSLEEIEALPPTQRDLRAIAIDDTRLMAIARHLPMLDYLFINSNSQVTDIGIRVLCHSWRSRTRGKAAFQARASSASKVTLA
jgi:hypothetical protein